MTAQVKAFIATKRRRYEPKFANGTWTVFDNVFFGAARVARDEKDAERQATELNTRAAAKAGK